MRMRHHSRSAASPSTRLILIDLVRTNLCEAETSIYRPLLIQARKTGVLIAHSYLSDGSSSNLNHQPILGLSPLPDEAVFIRGSQSTFSSRQFCDWVGATTGPLVFAGAAKTPAACTVMAVELFGVGAAAPAAVACAIALACSGPHGIYGPRRRPTPAS